MTELLNNRISVLERKILVLGLSSPTSDKEDFARQYDSIQSFLRDLIHDVQLPEDEQPNYSEF